MASNTPRCCGISFHDSPTTILKSLLIQLPLIYVLSAVELVAWPFRVLLGRSRTPSILTALLHAQIVNVKEASLMPRMRCMTAAKFYRLSPRLSGLVFRAFNFLMLSACWGTGLAVIASIAHILS